MLLCELLKQSKIEYEIYGEDVEIRSVVPDSERVSEGSLYIAIKGIRIDGHSFIQAARENGANCAIVCREYISKCKNLFSDKDFTFVAVEDTRAAMAFIYAAFYQNPQSKLKFVGVTGTNGKTSTSRIIYEILSRSGVRCGLIGTMGAYSPSGKIDICPANSLANMTTPDPEELYKILAVMAEQGLELVIMEVSSHALKLSKLAPISFEVGIFTNLGEEHLDFHKDLDDYFEAKAKLFENCGHAVINIDDAYGRRLYEKLEKNSDISVFTCSQEGKVADFSATDISCRPRGIEYKLNSRHLCLKICSNLMGRFNVINSLEAIAATCLLGIAPRDIKDSLATLSTVEGRLEKIKLDKKVDFSVYVDYAHTPDALKNLLFSLRSFLKRDERIVLLFGCGGDRDKQKRAKMGKIATSMADFVIITSDNSRSEDTSAIISDILSGVEEISPYVVIEDRKNAIEYAIKNARKRDVIVLAGKGHENYEIIGDKRNRFCETEIVKQFVDKYCL